MSSSGSNGSGGGGGGSGPCGACKFLRRKCVKGCIFAPYFDSEQGATHFAAVHKVFGASNVSKLLLRLPLHKRLDAVVTICYEALARIRDPVYGCVAHIFALQQQVVNLQAELAFVQAHLSTLEIPTSQAMSSAHHPQQQQQQSPSPPLMVHNSNSIQQHYASSSMMSSTNTRATSTPTNLSSTQFSSLQSQETVESPSCCGPTHDHQQHFDDGELQALAREYVSRYFPEVKYQKSSSSY